MADIRGSVVRLPIEVSATAVLVQGVAGKKIRVLGFVLSGNGTVNVRFQSGAGSPQVDISGPFYLAANKDSSAPFNPKGWFDTLVGDPLQLALSTGVAVGGILEYVLVP